MRARRGLPTTAADRDAFIDLLVRTLAGVRDEARDRAAALDARISRLEARAARRVEDDTEGGR